ncbi:MAG: glutaminyl-peptide cyclotransferase [Acidobacteria bacterium]|nr:glutaminyl-peptide cyclotransferase [Acidobacteriota bacterium]
MRFFPTTIFTASLLLTAAPSVSAENYRVVHSYPHDQHAFSQGLIYVDGHLYESTGIQGQSTLREEDLETGRILRMQIVSDRYFAEGLTDWKNTLIQLTWQSHVALVYDRATFRQLRTFQYQGEGWGLTHDAESLILSDGTATLRFFDPETFKELRRITVKDHGKPVTQLNELEFIHGEIYANIWHANRIARISPANGRVLGWIDLKGLMPRDQLSRDEAVLNGIAYDAHHDRLFVTGKLWPKVFEITVLPEHAKSPSAKHAERP